MVRSAIREARIRSGLTQREMSSETGIPLRTIENWETGTRTPAAWVEKLAVEKLESLAGTQGSKKDREQGKSDIDLMAKTELRGLSFYELLEDITETVNKDVDLLPEYQSECLDFCQPARD